MMERVKEAIDICIQLSDKDSKSCVLLSPKIKFSSLEDLTTINQQLQDAKLSHYSNLKVSYENIQEAQDDIHDKTDKEEIASEYIYLLEQSFEWWTIYNQKISKCDNNVKQINNKLKKIKLCLTELLNDSKSSDFQANLKNLICSLHLEERQLKASWDVINSLLGDILEPIPFVDIECLEHKVHGLRNDFYNLEEEVANCLQTCDQALEPTKCSKLKSKGPGISIQSTTMLIIIFIITFAILFMVLVTLMMDDMLSSFIWLYHDQIAPS